ncbi:SDR family oxidoreductase [Athalassotoga sp.]|uniref:SDR family oxidoreductase n=1 Tax=Athalassotoga sp. TaxID=2022597 RepID=UPI003D023605
MKLSGNTVLITGGGSGIGLAMAEYFLSSGNDVIICGRRESKLLEVKSRYHQVNIRKCDLSNVYERATLVSWVTNSFKNLNVLVNNAGIQKDVDLTKGLEGLVGEDEIRINLESPIHLSAMLIPYLMKQPESAIINISSGLAITPMASFPIYCATKAAIHSFSQSLRYQLARTTVKVFEILPPALDTELNKEGRLKRAKMGFELTAPKPDEYVKEVMKQIEMDKFEISNPNIERLKTLTLADLEKRIDEMNSKFRDMLPHL